MSDSKIKRLKNQTRAKKSEKDALRAQIMAQAAEFTFGTTNGEEVIEDLHKMRNSAMDNQMFMTAETYGAAIAFITSLLLEKLRSKRAA